MTKSTKTFHLMKNGSTWPIPDFFNKAGTRADTDAESQTSALRLASHFKRGTYSLKLT